MMTLWRLSNSDSLDGGPHPGGRWLGGGVPVVVLDPTPLAAICARLALVEAQHPRKLPHSYRLLEVLVPQRCILALPPPRAWRQDTAAARAFGHAWLEEGKSLVLRVPSISGAEQFLLNCGHADMALCRVQSRFAHPFEEQLEAVGPLLADGDWLVRTSTAGRGE